MFNSFINWFKNLFSYTEQPTFEPLKDVEPDRAVDGKHSRAYVSPSTPFARALDREGLIKPRISERCSCGYVMADCNIYRNTPRCKKYIEPIRQDSGSDDMLLSAAILSGLMSNHNVSAAPEVFTGKGGTFGGAGAEDSWDVPSSVSTTSTPTSPVVEQAINYAVASEVVTQPEAAPDLSCRASDPDPTPSSSDYSSSSSSDYSSSSSDSSSSSSSDSGSSSSE